MQSKIEKSNIPMNIRQELWVYIILQKIISDREQEIMALLLHDFLVLEVMLNCN